MLFYFGYRLVITHCRKQTDIDKKDLISNYKIKVAPKDKLEISYADFLETIDLNRKVSGATSEQPLKWIVNIFDRQQSIFNYHYWTMEYFARNAHRDDKAVLTAAYVKNMHTFFAATELTKQGLYGSARILLRHIFEFLIIGKYVSLTNDIKFIEHWLQDGQININKQIFRKIKSPDTKSLENFYSLLCTYTHATSSSQQVGIKIENNENQIYETLLFILILLECNYHLLNSHFIDSQMSYYANTRFKADIKTKKDELKFHFQTIKKEFLKKDALKLISSYQRKWTF